MSKKIKIILIVLPFLILVFALLFKTFFINRPRLSPELTANFYLQQEQFGKRAEAEKYLFDSLSLVEGEEFKNFDKVEILGENYNNLKNLPYKKREGPREFEIKEVKAENSGVTVNLVETILREVYFFNFLLSRDYQEGGRIEFEIFLTKTGSWGGGYEWKILKITSPTLIQAAKIGEEKEIKKGVFMAVGRLQEPEKESEESAVVYGLPVLFKNKSGKDYKISSAEWKITGQHGKKFMAEILEENLKSGREKGMEFEFNIPEEFVFKEVVFRNEGMEIYFTGN